VAVPRAAPAQQMQINDLDSQVTEKILARLPVSDVANLGKTSRAMRGKTIGTLRRVAYPICDIVTANPEAPDYSARVATQQRALPHQHLIRRLTSTLDAAPQAITHEQFIAYLNQILPLPPAAVMTLFDTLSEKFPYIDDDHKLPTFTATIELIKHVEEDFVKRALFETLIADVEFMPRQSVGPAFNTMFDAMKTLSESARAHVLANMSLYIDFVDGAVITQVFAEMVGAYDVKAGEKSAVVRATIGNAFSLAMSGFTLPETKSALASVLKKMDLSFDAESKALFIEKFGQRIRDEYADFGGWGDDANEKCAHVFKEFAARSTSWNTVSHVPAFDGLADILTCLDAREFSSGLETLVGMVAANRHLLGERFDDLLDLAIDAIDLENGQQMMATLARALKFLPVPEQAAFVLELAGSLSDLFPSDQNTTATWRMQSQDRCTALIEQARGNSFQTSATVNANFQALAEIITERCMLHQG
jgi:hypothetical protein